MRLLKKIMIKAATVLFWVLLLPFILLGDIFIFIAFPIDLLIELLQQ